jgi:RNA-directed DNA polymerase
MHENRESHVIMSVPNKTINRLMKANQTVDQQADNVAVGGGRSTDEALKAAAEVTEGRSEPKGNADKSPDTETPSSGYSSSGLMRVRQAAEKNGKERFTALLHHVTEQLLTEAYEELNCAGQAKSVLGRF